MDVKKSDLIQQLVEKHKYTKKSAAAVVDDFVDAIIENLRNGNCVSIYGFGKFDALERKARSCPNPQTGGTVEVPAHYVPRFYPSKRLRLAVKMWEDDARRGLI